MATVECADLYVHALRRTAYLVQYALVVLVRAAIPELFRCAETLWRLSVGRDFRGVSVHVGV